MNKRPKMLSAIFVKNVNVPDRNGLGLTLCVKPAFWVGYCKSGAHSIRIIARTVRPWRRRPNGFSAAASG